MKDTFRSQVNHSNVNVKKTIKKQNDNIKFNTLANCTTLYHIYRLLHCKRCTQVTSNQSNVNAEIETIIE